MLLIWVRLKEYSIVILDNEIKLVKLWELYCYWILMSMYFGDVYVLAINTITIWRDVYFICITNWWCRNMFWVRTWHILFITNIRQSDFEPASSWRLDFWNVSFGTSAIQSYVETLGSWMFDFGPPGSWLMLGLVIYSPWLIQPHRGTNMRLWLALWRYSCLLDMWWLGGWYLVK